MEEYLLEGNWQPIDGNWYPENPHDMVESSSYLLLVDTLKDTNVGLTNLNLQYLQIGAKDNSEDDDGEYKNDEDEDNSEDEDDDDDDDDDSKKENKEEDDDDDDDDDDEDDEEDDDEDDEDDEDNDEDDVNNSLAEILSNNTTLKRLRFENCTITNKEWNKLERILSVHPNLRSISLHNRNMSWNNLYHFASIIQQNKRIRQVEYVMDNDINQTSIHYPQLVSPYLTSAKIKINNKTGLHHYITNLSQCAALNILSLQSYHLKSPKYLRLLFDSLPICIGELNLSNSKISNAQTPIIASYLRKSHLYSLNLSLNEISAGIIDIGEALKDNVSLIDLDVSNNKIGTETHISSLYPLRRALLTNTTLSYLNLNDNPLQKMDLLELGIMVENNSTLSRLHVKVSSMDIEYVLRGMEKNTGIYELHVEYSSKQKSGILRSMLQKNNTLERLKITPDYSRETASSISKELSGNSTLTSLEIKNMWSTAESDFSNLIFAISTNPNLTELTLHQSNRGMYIPLSILVSTQTSLKRLALPLISGRFDQLGDLAKALNSNTNLSDLSIGCSISNLDDIKGLIRSPSLKSLRLGRNYLSENENSKLIFCLNSNFHLERLKFDKQLNKTSLHVKSISPIEIINHQRKHNKEMKECTLTSLLLDAIISAQ